MSIPYESVPLTLTSETLVGENVERWRKRRHMYQSELAAALGLSKSAVSRKIKGEIGWGVNDLVLAAHALDVPLQALLSETEATASLEAIRLARGIEDPSPLLTVAEDSEDTKTPRQERVTDGEPLRARRDSNPQPSDP